MIDSEAICSRWLGVAGHLEERGRRLLAAEVRAAGYGGLVAVARITGLARSTIGRGLNDLNAPALPAGTMRRPGNGRRPLTATDRTLLEDLGRLVEPAMMGDPGRPLVWVSKSWVKLAAAPQAMGHKVSANSVGKLLGLLGFTRHVEVEQNRASPVCHITQNWRGTPLISRQAIVELIGATATGTGLKVKCELDTKTYEKGVKVTDADMATLNIKGANFHPEWNHAISPKPSG